ncbi:MAG TPA: cytidylate kinase family protein [Candidatus Limnocylindrales bacterium]|nr:cytidylate kinase family protein [Candidatus Limnocylindrales bacterium]
MAVITISRGSFSGGKLLAECLADALGYRCVDRDVIVEKAAAYGVPHVELQNALMKPPSFWDRFKHSKYVYLTVIQAALSEEVRQGRAVYHGNAGHLLLRGVSHVLRARIIATMSFRLRMVEERLKLNRTDALAHVQKMDQDRKKWAQYLYGVEWGDPELYDLVLNLESLDIKAGCDVIATAARQPCFEETPESQATMENLVLASRVRATLAVAPQTSNLEVEVHARNGAVAIRGKLSSRAQLSAVDEIVRQVPGVAELALDLYSETTPA